MGDDAVTIEQLRAELCQARDEIDVLHRQEVLLVAEGQRRERALAEAYHVPISPHNAMGPLQVPAGAHAMKTVPNQRFA
jgi:hypothetical protein